MKNFKLDNEPKIKSGFKAPDEYFSTLTDTVLEQLPKQKPKVVPFYRKRPVWLSAAAVFIMFIAIGLLLQKNTTTVEPDVASIENYLVYQYNEYDLYQSLDATDIQELEQNIASGNVSNEAIENYITEQNNYDIYLIE
ncbi:hypothetical protein [Flavobacterium litorale]|uniref:Anti-sigma factor n=1 Tax=Flavobacterium litorale TaxID=2856519 RepID=A0ABX8V4J1_9FLAO|nr:hypothetical protein [Flavobacterium litorale]QYJ67758.1 hypothetical protein K1I41_09420 [Flavobacterium litorale]